MAVIVNIPPEQAKLVLLKNGWDVDMSVMAFIDNPASYDLADQSNFNTVASFN